MSAERVGWRGGVSEWTGGGGGGDKVRISKVWGKPLWLLEE